jgi:hypothetical protein
MYSFDLCIYLLIEIILSPLVIAPRAWLWGSTLLLFSLVTLPPQELSTLLDTAHGRLESSGEWKEGLCLFRWCCQSLGRGAVPEDQLGVEAPASQALSGIGHVNYLTRGGREFPFLTIKLRKKEGVSYKSKSDVFNKLVSKFYHSALVAAFSDNNRISISIVGLFSLQTVCGIAPW